MEKRTVNEGSLQGAPQLGMPGAPLQEAPQPGMSQYTQHYAPAHAPQQNPEVPGMTAPGASAQNGASQGGGAQSDEPPF